MWILPKLFLDRINAWNWLEVCFRKGPQTFIVCFPKMVCSLLRKYPMVSKILLISPFRTYRGPNGRGKSSTRKGARDVECRRGKKALCCVSNGNSYLNQSLSISLFIKTKPCSQRSLVKPAAFFSPPILKNSRSLIKQAWKRVMEGCAVKHLEIKR